MRQWKDLSHSTYSHDGFKAVPGRSRLCSLRHQVLPTGDWSFPRSRFVMSRLVLVLLVRAHCALVGRSSHTFLRWPAAGL